MTQITKKPPYLMIAILFFGAFVAFLNNTLLNVALPTIMVDLGIPEYSTVQWLSTGYMLAMVIAEVILVLFSWFFIFYSMRAFLHARGKEFAILLQQRLFVR